LENNGFIVKLPIECMNNEPNMPNYIGPNSFAEITFGFYYHKKVYEPYKN